MRPTPAVANYLIEVASHQGRTMTGLQLQTLIYFAHGLRLALVNEPLLDEPICANSEGVSIASLNAEGATGGRMVKEMFSHFEKRPGGLIDEIVWTPERNDPALPTLDLVWARFGNFSTEDLGLFVRTAESPWDVTWNDPARLENQPTSLQSPAREQVILNSLIRRWFRALILQEQKQQSLADGLERTVMIAGQRLEDTIRIETEKKLRQV